MKFGIPTPYTINIKKKNGAHQKIIFWGVKWPPKNILIFHYPGKINDENMNIKGPIMKALAQFIRD